MADSFFEGLVIMGSMFTTSRWIEQIIESKLKIPPPSPTKKEEKKTPKLLLKIFPSIGDESTYNGLLGAAIGGGLGLSLVWLGNYSYAINIGVTRLETVLGIGLIAGAEWFALVWFAWDLTRKSKIGISVILPILAIGGLPLLIGDVYYACEGIGIGLGLSLARFFIDLRASKE